MGNVEGYKYINKKSINIRCMQIKIQITEQHISVYRKPVKREVFALKKLKTESIYYF